MKGIVYYNGIAAGTIEKDSNGTYVFQYNDEYFHNSSYPPISITLPKTAQQYRSEKMFPFFYGLLAEGINKDIQCKLLRIDEEDDFTRLLKTAGSDTIGAITVKEK